MDMSNFIIAKSDQLNADDLAGGPITVTVERVTGNDSADQPVSVHYVGDNGKPYKPCKSMRRVMVHVWGIDAKQYAGKSMTLKRDPEIMFGAMKVGGIRISHMSGIDAERSMALNATRGKKALYKVLPLKDAPRREEPGSIVSIDDFRKRLQEAAERGTKALETAWKDRNMGPLREHIENGELDALKETAAAADSFSQPRPTDGQGSFSDERETQGGGYDGA